MNTNTNDTAALLACLSLLLAGFFIMKNSVCCIAHSPAKSEYMCTRCKRTAEEIFSKQDGPWHFIEYDGTSMLLYPPGVTEINGKVIDNYHLARQLVRQLETRELNAALRTVRELNDNILDGR